MVLVQNPQQLTAGPGGGAAARLRRVVSSPAWQLVGRRLLSLIPVLWGVTFLTYLVMSALPNDTAQALLGLKATKAQVAALNHALGLDQPFWVRYWKWLDGVLHGNLGTSITGESVGGQIATHLPVTLELVAYALVVALILAVLTSAVAARRPYGIVDRCIVVVATAGVAVAGYIFAFLVIIVFAVKLGWFPVVSGSLGNTPLSYFKNLTLPASSLGFPLWAIFTVILRADMIDQMQHQDYVLTAKAKGLTPWKVLLNHALRNSVFNLITLVGLQLGGLVGGAAIIETIFSVPGIGSDLLNSIGNHDVPLIEGIVLVFALITVLGNLLADISYTVLDPRIRYGSSSS